MKNNTLLSVTLLVGLVCLGMTVWLLFLYNGIVQGDERADRQWGQVQVQLERRMDLVPNLITAVQNYMTHEKDTLLAVANARTKALVSLRTNNGHAEGDLQQTFRDQKSLSDSLHTLIQIVESNPDLKSNETVISLQDQLEGTENRIATERMRYNDAVGSYNESLRSFPSSVIAEYYHFKPRPYFESKLGSEDAPSMEHQR